MVGETLDRIPGGTPALRNYLHAQDEVQEFFGTVLAAALALGSAAPFIKQRGNLESVDDPAVVELLTTDRAATVIREHGGLLCELMLCRTVDDFLIYLSDLLRQVFQTKPETLKSSGTVRIDSLLEHQSMDDVIGTLAEKRVNELAYQGTRDLERELREKIGIELFPDAKHFKTAIRVIESRNLVVHNRGYVNKIFLQRVPDSPTALGERLEITEGAFRDVVFLMHAAMDIDERCINKFGLQKVPIELPKGWTAQ